MLEKLPSWPVLLKGAAAFFAALVLLQLVGLAFAKDPLKNVAPPDLQALNPTESESETNDKTSKPPQTSAREKARQTLIKDSEIFAPKSRPQPMTIMGQAGGAVLLRAPNGREIWIAEGQETNGVKLLKTAINRALVVHDGKTNEITLHGGFGSESLLKRK